MSELIHETEAGLANDLARARESEDRLRTIIDAIPEMVWSAHADGSACYLNRRWLDYSGLSLGAAQGRGWEAVVHSDDIGALRARWTEIIASQKAGEAEARVRRADGEYRWHLFRVAPLFDPEGHILNWYATNTDIDDRKRAETLLAGENKILGMIAGGDPLERILDELCRLIEKLSPGSLCGIVLVDPTGARLEHGAAPSLPAGYNAGIHGRPVNLDSGPCARAAFLKEQVIAADVATDLRWKTRAWDVHALAHGLRSCWSTPILSAEGPVLGVFAIYSREPRTPTAQDQKLIRQTTHLAAVAIERQRAEGELRRSEGDLAQSQRLTLTSSFVWKVSTGELSWSREKYRLLGYEPSVKPDIELYFNRCHPDDLAGIKEMLARAAREGTDMDCRHRLVMPDGSIKHIRLMARNIGRDSGQYEFVGAVVDVTKQHESESSLAEALAKVRQSEDQLRTIIDTIPEMVWGARADGWAEYLNKRWLDYAGLTRENAGGWGWVVAIHPDDVDAFIARWKTIIASREPGDMEARIRRFDGVYRWYLFRGAPLFDAKGNLINWYGTNTDIDDLKRAEALLAAEKRLFEMIATGQTLPAILDTLCRLVEELNGGSPTSILLYDAETNRLRTGAAPNLPEEFSRAVDGALVTPTAGTCAAAVYRKELVQVCDTATDPLWAGFRDFAAKHHLRACWSTPIVSGEGAVLGTIATYAREARQITPLEKSTVEQFTHLARIVIERKRVDDALRKSEAFLAEGQRLSRTGSWGWNLATDRVMWSEEHGRIFGYRVDEVGGTFASVLERLHPDERATLLATVGGAVQAGRDFSCEYQIVLPEGSTKQVQSVGRPVIGASGEVTEYIGTTVDITERKRAEEELRQREADLRKAHSELAHVTRVTTMGEFAASIAHEVNQPIAGVVLNGNACLRWLAKLDRDPANLGEAREAVQRIIRDGTRAGQVIARIRALFKNTETEKEPLDFNEAIREILVLARSEMDKRRVALRLDLAPGLPPVLGDRVQLQQVMLNLILNAIEAMIAVDVGKRELVIRTVWDGKPGALVAVRDCGMGLDAASMDKIFTAFHTTKPGGLGMGLSISRSIVENHGGRLWATANDGPGATFQFTLPVSVSPGGGKQPAGAPAR